MQQQQERTSRNTSVQGTSDFVLRLVPSRSAISVGGIDLNKDSLIGSLRAGCNVCGVSAAGSKQKLHQRLLQSAPEGYFRRGMGIDHLWAHEIYIFPFPR